MNKQQKKVERKAGICRERVKQWADIAMLTITRNGEWDQHADGRWLIFQVVPYGLDRWKDIPNCKFATVSLAMREDEFAMPALQPTRWLDVFKARWHAALICLWELMDPNKDHNLKCLEDHCRNET